MSKSLFITTLISHNSNKIGVGVAGTDIKKQLVEGTKLEKLTTGRANCIAYINNMLINNPGFEKIDIVTMSNIVSAIKTLETVMIACKEKTDKEIINAFVEVMHTSKFKSSGDEMSKAEAALWLQFVKLYRENDIFVEDYNRYGKDSEQSTAIGELKKFFVTECWNIVNKGSTSNSARNRNTNRHNDDDIKSMYA